MENSKIEWTNATWNPVVGCQHASAGCTNCYAQNMAHRLNAMGIPQYADTTARVNGNTVWTGKVNFAESQLLKPFQWRKPRMIFVGSMTDIFQEAIPYEWIDKIFAVMALCPQHTFQILTKRSDRMCRYLMSRNGKAHPQICRAINTIHLKYGDRRGILEMPLPNVWLGVSVENQRCANERIPFLLLTPSFVRWISAEPLLGPVKLKTQWIDLLDWVVVGGESGSKARPIKEEWIEEIHDQCRSYGTAFFFKQWGTWGADNKKRSKKENGREFRGRTWDEMPGSENQPC